MPPLPDAVRLADGTGWCITSTSSTGRGAGGARGAAPGAALKHGSLRALCDDADDALDGGWGAGCTAPGEAGRRAVAAFCTAVAAHPLLRECPALALFLQEDVTGSGGGIHAVAASHYNNNLATAVLRGGDAAASVHFASNGHDRDVDDSAPADGDAAPQDEPATWEDALQWYERGGAVLGSTVAATLASLMSRLSVAGSGFSGGLTSLGAVTTAAAALASGGDGGQHEKASNQDEAMAAEAAAYATALEEALNECAAVVSASAASCRSTASTLRALHGATAALAAPEADIVLLLGNSTAAPSTAASNHGGLHPRPLTPSSSRPGSPPPGTGHPPGGADGLGSALVAVGAGAADSAAACDDAAEGLEAGCAAALRSCAKAAAALREVLDDRSVAAARLTAAAGAHAAALDVAQQQMEVSRGGGGGVSAAALARAPGASSNSPWDDVACAEADLEAVRAAFDAVAGRAAAELPRAHAALARRVGIALRRFAACHGDAAAAAAHAWGRLVPGATTAPFPTRPGVAAGGRHVGKEDN